MEMKEIISQDFDEFVRRAQRRENEVSNTHQQLSSMGFKYIENPQTHRALSLLELKYRWLCEDIFHIEVGDDVDLSIEFGKTIVEVMNVIRDRRNDEYIADKSNYVKFMIVCNIFHERRYIDWISGESIRECWLEYCNLDEDWNEPDFVIRPNIDENIKWSYKAVNYLLDVFFKEEEKGKIR